MQQSSRAEQRTIKQRHEPRNPHPVQTILPPVHFETPCRTVSDVVGPDALGFPLVDDLFDLRLAELRAAECIADDALEFRIAKGDDVLVEVVDVHVRVQRRLRHRRVRGRDHRVPAADVVFVDLLHLVVQVKLRGQYQRW